MRRQKKKNVDKGTVIQLSNEITLQITNFDSDVDIPVIGEPNGTKIKTPGWFSDTRGDIAICDWNKNTEIHSMSKKVGYTILNYKEISIHSCYISPNIL